MLQNISGHLSLLSTFLPYQCALMRKALDQGSGRLLICLFSFCCPLIPSQALLVSHRVSYSSIEAAWISSLGLYDWFGEIYNLSYSSQGESRDFSRGVGAKTFLLVMDEEMQDFQNYRHLSGNYDGGWSRVKWTWHKAEGKEGEKSGSWPYHWPDQASLNLAPFLDFSVTKSKTYF